MVERGAPVAANKLLKVTRTFFAWCVGKAILDVSPCEGIQPPTHELARDRVLSDQELAAVLRGAEGMGGPYGGIVTLLALTGQRREEVAQMWWDELCPASRIWTIPSRRAKKGRPHLVHLSDPTWAVLESRPRLGPFVFAVGRRPFQSFSQAKREIDRVSGVKTWRLHDLRRMAVSGMARLGVAPHVADKILNHASGAISGVAAVYQRHEFMSERKQALERWGEHVATLRAIGATPAPDVPEQEVRSLVSYGRQAEAGASALTPRAA